MNDAQKLYELLRQSSAVMDDVPKGFKTVKQWAVEFGKSLPRTYSVLKDNKNVERKSFRIKTGDSCRPVPHYRIKLKA